MIRVALFNYFINSLWQVPLLALFTSLAVRIARPSVRTRYTLWIATLLLCVGLPARGTATLPQDNIDLSTQADVDAPPLHAVPQPRALLPFFAVPISQRTCDLLVGLYLTLTGVCLLRLAASHLAVRRLIAASTPRPLSPAETALLASTAIHAHSPACPVRTLPAPHATPLVAGILHPVILLPESLHANPTQNFRAILAHEFAHIQRRDVLTNTLLRLLSLPVAYHPATTLIHRRIRHTCEMLCDTLAATRMASPTVYANALIALAARLLHADTADGFIGLFQRTSQPLLSHSFLEERIMNLITPPPPAARPRRVLRFASAALVFSAAAATASFVHLTPTVLAAQQTAAPAPQTAPATQPQPAPISVPQPRPLNAQQRRQLDQQIRKSTETLSDPAFQKRLHDLTQQAIDPAFQARLATQMKAIQDQIASSPVNSPAFQKSMADLKQQLDSPEFQKQIHDAAEQARKAALESSSQKKMLADIRKQLNSPEFKQQIAAARAEALKGSTDYKIDQADLQRRLADAQQSLAAASAQQQPDSVKVSAGIMAGQVVSKVAPIYPPDARAAHISGSVIMHARIGENGHIEALQVVSGPQELQTSALDAVRQWVYKPYLLNGQPTAVETTITVNYSFGEDTPPPTPQP